MGQKSSEGKGGTSDEGSGDGFHLWLRRIFPAVVVGKQQGDEPWDDRPEVNLFFVSPLHQIKPLVGDNAQKCVRT